MLALSPSAASQPSTKSPTIRRILREAAEIFNSPSPDYTTEPLESDLFEWHFTLKGPPNSVYSDGLYHGRIILPPTYPLRPPSFRFTTPSGRFEANREICLSISGHHEETWQPAWGIRTALVALRSFMETDARGQLGGIDTTDVIRRRLAHESGSFRCVTCARSNADIIADAEMRARQSSIIAKEVLIPQELKIGWKDEMGAVDGDKVRDVRRFDGDMTLPLGDGDDTSKGLELAEGPGRTRWRHTPAGSSPGLPTSPNSHRPPPQQTAPSYMTQHNVVPLWIDRIIVSLVIVLAALLLKVLFGL